MFLTQIAIFVICGLVAFTVISGIVSIFVKD
jgi:hypothetical protein